MKKTQKTQKTQIKSSVSWPIIGILFVVIFFAGAAVQNHHSLFSTKSKAPIEYMPKSSLKTGFIGNTYTNSDYLFQLTFPDSWKNVEVSSTNPISAGFGPDINVPVTSFIQKEPIKATPGYYREYAFRLYFFSQLQWQTIRNLKTHPTYLGENSKFVIAWDKDIWPDQCHAGLRITNCEVPPKGSEAFIPIWNDIEKIPPTFKNVE